MKSTALVLIAALSMTACSKKFTQVDIDNAKANGTASGKSEAEVRAVKAAGLIAALYEGNSPAAYDFSLVKFGRDNANFAVIKVAGVVNETFAVDISNYTNGTNYNTYLASNTGYYNLTANGDGTYSCNSGSCTTYLGAATSSSMVFEKTTGSMKDLDKAAAFVEQLKVETLASGIATQFGLSDERSIKVAKLASSWEKLSKSRALTNEDSNAFAMELAGVNFDQIDSAYKAITEGSTDQMKTIVEKAAQINGTTSENMTAIMMKLFSNEND